jgi:hypothetical protein
MKKLFILLGLFTFASVSAQQPQPVRVSNTSSGPQVRLHGYTQYAFDDNDVNSYYSTTEYFDGKVKGGFQYGGGIEVMPYEFAGIEFTYLRLDSKSPMEYYNGGVVYTTFDLAQNWLFLSFNKYVPVQNEKIEPFAGLQVGIDILNATNPDNGNSGSATKFAWGFKAGTHIWASEKVGLKIQLGLMSAVQAIGGGVYFGTGGAGAGVSGFSTYYQFNVGGGLVFRLR